jgi:uncharacterized protein YhbP (UPF0306 family)
MNKNLKKSLVGSLVMAAILATGFSTASMAQAATGQSQANASHAYNLYLSSLRGRKVAVAKKVVKKAPVKTSTTTTAIKEANATYAATLKAANTNYRTAILAAQKDHTLALKKAKTAAEKEAALKAYQARVALAVKDRKSAYAIALNSFRMTKKAVTPAKTIVKKAPVKKAVVKKAPVKKAVVKKAPVKTSTTTTAIKEANATYAATLKAANTNYRTAILAAQKDHTLALKKAKTAAEKEAALKAYQARVALAVKDRKSAYAIALNSLKATKKAATK